MYDFRKSHVLDPHHGDGDGDGDGDGVTHPLGELSKGSQKAAPVLACVLQPAPGCNHHHVIMGMVMFMMIMLIIMIMMPSENENADEGDGDQS